MRSYIKVNSNNDIIDIFFEYQKNKFDGTEIYFGDIPKKHKIDGESLSSEYGAWLFNWDGDSAIRKDSNLIEAESIGEYKKKKRQELVEYVNQNWPFESSRTDEQIYTAWQNFKPTVKNATSFAEIDAALAQAIAWLNVE